MVRLHLLKGMDKQCFILAPFFRLIQGPEPKLRLSIPSQMLRDPLSSSCSLFLPQSQFKLGLTIKLGMPMQFRQFTRDNIIKV